MKLFDAFPVRDMVLKNRMVMPPMCMYQVEDNDGVANSFHLGHYTARAIGQVGLIIVESTGVSPNGRITDQCLGLWDDAQINNLRRIVDAVHHEGSKIAIQLNHAGRKSETSNLKHVGPSKINYNDEVATYEELITEEIEKIVDDFKSAALRADQAGFDAIEIHGAHGYLIHQFISPLSNQRKDKYGEDRFLFLKELTQAIKSVWPKNKMLLLRISATDFLEDGLQLEDWIQFFSAQEDLYDFIHVSAGGVVNAPIHVYPGYMVDFAREIRERTSYKTIAVGLLNEADLVNYTLESGASDLVACGRVLLRDANFYLRIAKARGREDLVPEVYKRAF